MRTSDALAIGMALGRIRGTIDAWEESKHPRRPDGKFGSGGGSSKSSSKTNSRAGGAYSSLTGIHQEDVDEILKSPLSAHRKYAGEFTANDFMKVKKIHEDYRTGKKSKESARNEIAAIYKDYHEDYD